MLRSRKEELIVEWREQLSDVPGAVLADFCGLTVGEISDFRRLGREHGVAIRVVSNRIFKRAVAGTQWDAVMEHLVGPIAIVYHLDDPVAPAKVAVKFAKGSKLEVKAGLLSGQAFDEQGVVAFSKLAGKNELRAKLLAMFQAPAQTFVRLMAAGPTSFLYLLDARRRGLEDAS